MKYIKIALLLPVSVLLACFAVEIFLRGLPLFWKGVSGANKDNEHIYVYVIGESTARGEPYTPKISYPDIVKYMFNNKINGKEISIINISQQGSHLENQYWNLFKELSINPHLDSTLFLYAGINDCYSAENGNAFKRILNRSFVYSKINLTLNREPTCSYGCNLEKVIILAQSYGIKVVLSNLIGNFTEFAPQENNIFSSDVNKKLLEKARQLESKGDLDGAEGIYKKISASDKGQNMSYVYYRLGKIYRKERNFDAAKKYYYLASDLSARRPSSSQNEFIKEAATRYKLNFVDALTVFEKNSENGLIGWGLCGDAHHPNLKGYILIAAEFAKELGRIYGVAPARINPSEKEIMEYFNFDDDDRFNVDIHNIKWLLEEASTVVYRVDSLERVKYYLGDAKEICRSNPSDVNMKMETELSSLMVCAVSRDLEGVLYWLKKGEFLTSNRDVIEKKNDFFNTWLKNTLFDVELPDDIVSRIKIEPAEYERYKARKLNHIIVN